MQIIEYNYRNGRDRLKIPPIENSFYMCEREIFCPRSTKSDKWRYFEQLKFKTKTQIVQYILEKDPYINLDSLITFNNSIVSSEEERATSLGTLLISDKIIKPKFNLNTKVALIGYPNGIEERRGNIGDIGTIISSRFVKESESWFNAPTGYSYRIRSSSFATAIGNELWVHESNLEEI